MGMKKNTAMLSFMALAMAGSEGMKIFEDEETKSKKVKKEVVPPLPKGVKEYFFDISGKFSTVQMRKDECVFICQAINNKNALKKYNKWYKNNKDERE